MVFFRILIKQVLCMQKNEQDDITQSVILNYLIG